MKVAMINGGVFGSTGKIMLGIADLLEKKRKKIIFRSTKNGNNNANIIKSGHFFQEKSMFFYQG